jgi:hypothetical protein
MTEIRRFEVLHILAALGAGGMTASFFFLINYSTNHVGDAFVSFDVLYQHHLGEIDFFSILIQFFMIGAVSSAVLHFVLLSRWWRLFKQYKSTEQYQELVSSNKEVQLMAIPLTLSMSMNVCFILGAMFIPGLFSELSLFGLEMQLIDAMLVSAGVYFSWMLFLAVRFFGVYFLRLVEGEFDFVANANLSQMLALFSFGMIAVGFAALCFSKVPAIAAFGLIMSYIVLSLVVVLAFLKFALGFKSIFLHGVKPHDVVTLLLPITVIGMVSVALLRSDIGLFNAFDVSVDYVEALLRIIIGVGLSVIVALFALTVMRQKGFFKRMTGEVAVAGDLSLICPFFAFEIQLVLALAALVGSGLVEHGSATYFALWIPMLVVQGVGIYFYIKLLKTHKFLKLSV